MYGSESRIYLDPPLKNVREIQLLDCNIKTKRFINFKEQQIFFDERNNQPIITMQPGTYLLRDIQSVFIKFYRSNITLIEGDTIDYLYSNNNFKIKLTRGLQIGFGLPEIINPNKLYSINIQIKEPLRLMCSIVDNKFSYMNKTKYGELVKLTPSQLLANIPSKDYPAIPVQKYESVLNHFDLSILDNEWEKLDFKGTPITFSLRFR